MPPLLLVTVSAPDRSVMVMIVLLKEAKMCAMPHFSFSFAMLYLPAGFVILARSAWFASATGDFP